MYDVNELYDILDNHLDEHIEYEYIANHTEILPKLIAAYDLACWRCHPSEIREKLLNAILSVQHYLVPYLKKCFKENSFEYELDYIMDILSGLSTESIRDMEDELIIAAQDEKWYGGWYAFDILKLLIKHDPNKKNYFAPLLRDRLEEALKKRTDLQSRYPKNFVGLDDYREEQTIKFFPNGFSSSREKLHFECQVSAEWSERYGNDKQTLDKLEGINEYINEINDLLNNE